MTIIVMSLSRERGQIGIYTVRVAANRPIHQAVSLARGLIHGGARPCPDCYSLLVEHVANRHTERARKLCEISQLLCTCVCRNSAASLHQHLECS